MEQVLLHDAAGAVPHRDGVLAVWREAFGPVDDEAEWIETVWDRHRGRDDYRLATAHVDDVLAGFAWGYTGGPGQYWSDLVRERLGGVASEWVGGHFEFVELAVAPARRRRGIGRRLHDRLLTGLPHARGLLGTSADGSDPAVALYRSRGWTQIGLIDPDTQVMGVLRPGRLGR